LTTILKLSAVISLCLAVNACSPAAAPKHETSAADGTVTNGVVTYSATDFHESSPGRSGGTLRVSAASDAGSFDVHALSNGNIQWMGRILFDCLVYQDEQGNISPWLARSWDISDDGKTYKATVTPIDANTLKVRGCIFVPLCKTQTWTRVR